MSLRLDGPCLDRGSADARRVMGHCHPVLAACYPTSGQSNAINRDDVPLLNWEDPARFAGLSRLLIPLEPPRD